MGLKNEQDNVECQTINPELKDTETETANKSNRKERHNVHARTSDLPGIAGILETLVRTFRSASFIFIIAPLAIIYTVAIGLALSPGYMLTQFIYERTQDSSLFLQAFSVCSSVAITYFIYGLTIIFIVPFFNKILFLKLKPWRGGWFSLGALPWYYHNALTQLVRYTFLDLVTPSPLNVLFYKMMGMKVGKGVMINTTNISDPCLITLEDNVTIGGSATIFAHYAQAGYLVLAPVVVKKGATVGLKASIMGDVIVGEKVTVKPHNILLPKTRLNKGDPQ